MTSTPSRPCSTESGVATVTDVIRALFAATLTVSLTTAPIIAILALARRPMERFRASTRYLLWMFVLVRLAIPLTLPVTPATFAFALPTAQTDDAAVDMPSNDVPADPFAGVPSITDMPLAEPDTGTFAPAEPAPTEPAPAVPPIDPTSIAAWVWAIAALAIFAYRFGRSVALNRRLAQLGTPMTDPSLLLGTAKLAARLGLKACPPIRLVQGIGSPLVCGVLRPTVLLPDGIDAQALPRVLAHELTHVRRRDIPLRLVAMLALSLHWFDPLAYLAARQFEAECELSCDEAVLRGCDTEARRAYGHVLLGMLRAEAKASAQTEQSAVGLTTRFRPSKGSVRARFVSILDTSPKRAGRGAIAAVLILCLCAGLFVACVDPAEPDEGERVITLGDTPSTNGDTTTAPPTTTALPETTAAPAETTAPAPETTAPPETTTPTPTEAPFPAPVDSAGLPNLAGDVYLRGRVTEDGDGDLIMRLTRDRLYFVYYYDNGLLRYETGLTDVYERGFYLYQTYGITVGMHHFDWRELGGHFAGDAFGDFRRDAALVPISAADYTAIEAIYTARMAAQKNSDDPVLTIRLTTPIRTGDEERDILRVRIVNNSDGPISVGYRYRLERTFGLSRWEEVAENGVTPATAQFSPTRYTIGAGQEAVIDLNLRVYTALTENGVRYRVVMPIGLADGSTVELSCPFDGGGITRANGLEYKDWYFVAVENEVKASVNWTFSLLHEGNWLTYENNPPMPWTYLVLRDREIEVFYRRDDALADRTAPLTLELSDRTLTLTDPTVSYSANFAVVRYTLPAGLGLRDRVGETFTLRY